MRIYKKCPHLFRFCSLPIFQIWTFWDFMQQKRQKMLLRASKSALYPPENGWNRYQSSIYMAQSRNGSVTKKCYMAKKSGIWQIIIPNFQVLTYFGNWTQGDLQAKIMTNKLHDNRMENNKSNDARIVKKAWNIRMYGLKKANFLNCRKKCRKGLQSFFLCGMISVDSYAHFEVRKNFWMALDVTFM